VKLVTRPSGSVTDCIRFVASSRWYVVVCPSASVIVVSAPMPLNRYVVGLPRGSTNTVATTGLIDPVGVHGAWEIGPPAAASFKSWRLAGVVAMSVVT
jgi:hypothetical protein